MGLDPDIVKEMRNFEKNGLLKTIKREQNSEVTTGHHKTLCFDDLMFNPEWQIEKSESHFFYKNGVIPRKVFFSAIGGNITVTEVHEAFEPIEKAFIDGEFAHTEYIRIVDYSQLENASIQSRRIYGRYLIDLNEKYDAKSTVTFICSASPFLKMALNLFAKHVNQHFVFVSSVDEAFQKINQEKEIKNNVSEDEKIVSTKEIDVLLDMCGDILWDEKTANTAQDKTLISPDSSLYPIAESLSILNQDLKELREKELEQNKKLLQSEQRLRGFFNQSYDGMRLVDDHGIVIDESRSMEQITGISREESIGSYVWDVIYKYAPLHMRTSQFYERLKRKSMGLLETGNSDIIQQHDHSLLRPDGEQRIVHAITFPIKIGSKFMFGSLIRDITDQKEAERKLRESEERYKTLSENFPDGALFLFDRDLRYIFCDGKGLAEAGFSKEDFIGKTPKDIFSSEHTELIENHCYPVFNGKTTQYELILNGKTYTNKAVPVYNDDGEINEGIVITQEITKQKYNEQKVKEQQKKLASSNQELIRTNVELQDAQEALQTVNAHLQRKVEEKTADIQKLVDQKDDFIHMLSHDLKNPLTPILTLLPMLADKSDDPKVKEMIKKIISNTHRMKTIIQETLTLAQLSDQGKQIHPAALILTDEINTILAEHQSFFDENKVNLQINIKEDYKVYFDKTQFDHLISNLVTNAVKYTPDGTRCNLSVTATPKDDNVIISIRDNGVGLTKDQQKQVFEKFYRTGKPREGMESTGLGLSICKRIVDQHGGEIWAESDGPGKGSTFSFTIPLIQ